MADDKLANSLQESILALLCFNSKQGALVATQVKPEHFDGLYGEIAAAVLSYRRQFSRPPGSAHLDDLLLPSQLTSKAKVKAINNIFDTLTGLEEGINADYVAQRTQEFIRQQRLKTAVVAAGERLIAGAEDTLSEVEEILYEALRYREQTADAGTFLNDPKVISTLGEKAEFFSLGIPEFDRINLGLTRQEMLLFIAPKGKGKTTFCVWSGRQVILQGGKALHVSLEMVEQRVIPKYYQTFFGIAKRNKRLQRAILDFDEDNIGSFERTHFTPKLSFSDPKIRSILRQKVKTWGAKFGRLVVKHFPSGSLTLSALYAYLDFLESAHKFVPDVLIVDYPDLMRIDSRNYRHDIAGIYVGLRGLAVERNMALLVPTQPAKVAMVKGHTKSHMVAEDIRKINTADNVLAYSQTDAEEHYGLARLSVEHARYDESNLQVLISQSYATGQFVLESRLMPKDYWESIKNSDNGEDYEDDDSEA